MKGVEFAFAVLVVGFTVAYATFIAHAFLATGRWARTPNRVVRWALVMGQTRRGRSAAAGYLLWSLVFLGVVAATVVYDLSTPVERVTSIIGIVAMLGWTIYLFRIQETPEQDPH